MKDQNRQTITKYRLQQAEEILRDANTLLDNKGSARSIINRAYYAMFYATLSLLATINKGSAKHSGVIALFDQHFVKPGLIPREKSKSLHKAFDLRQLADYQELTLIDMHDAKDVLAKAEEFVHSIDEFLKKQV